jgi:nitroreductase
MLIDPIARRRSPRAFDPDHDLTAAARSTLLEAARWAPSAGNRQPWAFLVGHRGDPTFKGVADTLSGNNQVWAPTASALLVAMAEHEAAADRTSAGRAYELGLAVGQLTVQAEAMGLVTHQMGGFDGAQLRAEFSIPEHLRPIVVIAVGAPGDPEQLPSRLRAREAAPRERQPQSAWVFTGGWA